MDGTVEPHLGTVSPAEFGSFRRMEQFRSVLEQTPGSLAGNLIAGLVIGSTFWSVAPVLHLAGWAAAMVLVWLLRLAHYLRYRRERNSVDAATLLRWRRSWSAVVLVQGLCWGAASWLFYGLGSDFHLTALMVTMCSYCVGAVQLLATQTVVFTLFAAFALTPLAWRVAADTSQPYHGQLAFILCLAFGTAVVLAHTYRGAMAQAISLKVQTDKLAAQLRVEMASAEAARRTAEAANRAKTQFFGAASHDLRQPLHAMGLFAEALRQRSHDPEVASLVHSINESVDALEGLFGELLDITRIDSGGVEVNPGPVSIRDLFARLRLTFEPTAFEKGLALSFRGERHVAHADPVVVERILRNLVSNAIRYCEDGGVLVSCRPRGGKLLLQVWDTGIGISESSLPHIFDEFYQVQSNRPLEPHHRKGLGLGLAIVKRLADLMQAPLAVQSRAGRGSVFSLEVPVGKAPRATLPSAGVEKAALGVTLQHRLIVVVEDEAAVRDGLVVLLKAWGASVVAFDTVAAASAWLQTAPPEKPDLLIVDYRLPEGSTGLDALAAVRAHWAGQHIPAILVTGSSLGGHEDESIAHDFHLLIKPVLPNKLRAMIGFKLGVR